MSEESDLTVLAVDPSFNPGFCVRQGELIIILGSRKFGQRKKRVALFHQLIEELFETHRPDVVVTERPFVRHITACGPMYGTTTLLRLACDLTGTPLLVTVPAQHQSAFLRPKKLPRKSAAIKQAMLEQCKKRGWNPSNHDEADALSLADFAVKHLV